MYDTLGGRGPTTPLRCVPSQFAAERACLRRSSAHGYQLPVTIEHESPWPRASVVCPYQNGVGRLADAHVHSFAWRACDRSRRLLQVGRYTLDASGGTVVVDAIDQSPCETAVTFRSRAACEDEIEGHSFPSQHRGAERGLYLVGSGQPGEAPHALRIGVGDVDRDRLVGDLRSPAVRECRQTGRFASDLGPYRGRKGSSLWPNQSAVDPLAPPGRAISARGGAKRQNYERAGRDLQVPVFRLRATFFLRDFVPT